MTRVRGLRTIGEHVAEVLARLPAGAEPDSESREASGGAGAPLPPGDQPSARPPTPLPSGRVQTAFPLGGSATPLPLDVAAEAGPGLVLADDVVAALPVPGFDHAAVDGYAVRLADVPGSEPATLAVIGAVRAGDRAGDGPGPGQAVRIMTGAPLPAGADAVVPVEATSTGRFEPGGPDAEATVTLIRPRKDNIRRRGEDLAAGARLGARGGPVTPALIAAAAAAGVATLSVAAQAGPGHGPRVAGVDVEAHGSRPHGHDSRVAGVDVEGHGSRPSGHGPRVAVISTGSELRPAGPEAGTGGVVDSNSLMLAAIVRAAGGVPRRLSGVPDDAAALRSALDEVADDVDLIVTTGGVSAGAWDVVRLVLTEPGSRATDVDLTGVAMRPGRPQGLAVWRGVPWIALPGTPVAAFVSAHLFVRPAITALRGGHDPAAAFTLLPAGEPFGGSCPVASVAGPDGGERACGTGFTRVVPVRTTERVVVRTSASARGGHALSALLGADGLALVPPDGLRPGDLVEVVPL